MSWVELTAVRSGEKMPVYIQTDKVVTVLKADDDKVSQGLNTTIRFVSKEYAAVVEDTASVMLAIRAAEAQDDGQ